MEDVSRRLVSLETAVTAIKAELTTALHHLATKEDVALAQADVNAIKAQMPHLATKADVLANKADIADMKASLIQWMVSTTLAAAALAFAIAKFVH